MGRLTAHVMTTSTETVFAPAAGVGELLLRWRVLAYVALLAASLAIVQAARPKIDPAVHAPDERPLVLPER